MLNRLPVSPSVSLSPPQFTGAFYKDESLVNLRAKSTEKTEVILKQLIELDKQFQPLKEWVEAAPNDVSITWQSVLHPSNAAYAFDQLSLSFPNQNPIEAPAKPFQKVLLSSTYCLNDNKLKDLNGQISQMSTPPKDLVTTAEKFLAFFAPGLSAAQSGHGSHQKPL